MCSPRDDFIPVFSTGMKSSRGERIFAPNHVNTYMRLCGRWTESIEGKPKLSTWQSFGNWLEKEAKISESKQRWIRKNGSGLTRLKVMDMKSLVTLGLGCLQERQENIPYPLEMWQRSVQFICLTARYKSAKV